MIKINDVTLDLEDHVLENIEAALSTQAEGLMESLRASSGLQQAVGLSNALLRVAEVLGTLTAGRRSVHEATLAKYTNKVTSIEAEDDGRGYLLNSVTEHDVLASIGNPRGVTCDPVSFTELGLYEVTLRYRLATALVKAWVVKPKNEQEVS